MSLDTITQRWRASGELAQKLNAEFRSGRATRPACEVERRLAICRKCPEFRGNDCAELELHAEFQAGGDGDPVAPTYVQLLTREHLHCRRWRFDERPDRPKPDPVTASPEALERLHRQGVRRSQAERRAARREGRRRRKRVASGE